MRRVFGKIAISEFSQFVQFSFLTSVCNGPPVSYSGTLCLRSRRALNLSTFVAPTIIRFLLVTDSSFFLHMSFLTRWPRSSPSRVSMLLTGLMLCTFGSFHIKSEWKWLTSLNGLRCSRNSDGLIEACCCQERFREELPVDCRKNTSDLKKLQAVSQS